MYLYLINLIDNYLYRKYGIPVHTFVILLENGPKVHVQATLK